jgi:hypothetical protein
MKHPRYFAFVACWFASLLLAPGIRAQTTKAIAAARSQYILQEADGAAQLAQYSRPRPMAPPPYQARLWRGYETPWSDHGHLLIGAAIGFGLGAAAGAKFNTSTYPGATARAAFLCGGVGALLGAAIGANHGGRPYAFVHRRRTHRPSQNRPSQTEDSSGDLSAAVKPVTPSSGSAIRNVRAAINGGLMSDSRE